MTEAIFAVTPSETIKYVVVFYSSLRTSIHLPPYLALPSFFPLLFDI
jgi:hypothetical protein